MIGIYGGTFDPVHFGHLRTALELKQCFQLDQIHMIPSANPPHKLKPTTEPAYRLEMLRIGIGDCPGLIVDDRELKRSGPSYTIDTLRSISAEQPDDSLLLFMGMDAFAGIETWYQWRDLFNYAHVVVITRPGFMLPILSDFLQASLVRDCKDLLTQRAGKLYFQAVTSLEISATAIRQMIARGEDPHFLLPDKVLDFIQEHKLFQNAQA